MARPAACFMDMSALFSSCNHRRTLRQMCSPPGHKPFFYQFTGGSDGGRPGTGDLVFDGAGNIYGTTRFGGDLSAAVEEAAAQCSN